VITQNLAVAAEVTTNQSAGKTGIWYQLLEEYVLPTEGKKERNDRTQS
jgi:hypothetical protein